MGRISRFTKKVNDENWLAHRSEKGWPAQLKIPNAIPAGDSTSDYFVDWCSGGTSNASIQWYFAAVSGAKTENFNKVEQGKEYNQIIVSGTKPLPKQLDVFSYIEGDVDYVTLTIGGNDVGFADIVFNVVTDSTYLRFGKLSRLEKKLDNIWEDFHTTHRRNIEDAYKDEDVSTPS